MRATRYTVKYQDPDGGEYETRVMSLGEAAETEKRLRVNGALHVRRVNANAPKPAAGYSRDWRVTP